MGFRPAIPADMALGYRNVMEACWQPNDAARPTFDVILRSLQVKIRSLRHTTGVFVDTGSVWSATWALLRTP